MECSICQEDFDENDCKPFLMNPCGHSLCLKCINKLPSQLCPLCRGRITSQTINRGILDCVNSFKNTTNRASFNPTDSTGAISVSLKETLLNDLNALSQKLHFTVQTKQAESKQMLARIKSEIKTTTNARMNALLKQSNELLNQVEHIDEELSKMSKQSGSMLDKFELDIKGFDAGFFDFKVNEVSQMASRLKLSLNEKISEFERFDMSIEFREVASDDKSQTNSIGYISRAEKRNSLSTK